MLLEVTVTANSQIKPSQFLTLLEDKEQLEDYYSSSFKQCTQRKI
jgi:hypothetical protein